MLFILTCSFSCLPQLYLSIYLSLFTRQWEESRLSFPFPVSLLSIPYTKMTAAMLNVSASPRFTTPVKLYDSSSSSSSNLLPKLPIKKPQPLWTTLGVTNNGFKNGVVSLAVHNNRAPINVEQHSDVDVDVDDEDSLLQLGSESETYLYSFSPFLLAALLPGATTVRSLFGPFVELVKSWNLPDWLVHWGHPGNMAVVLLAMGGYGTYLGFRIRSSDDMDEKANAKDLHPKLMAGMFFFFALGATGGVTSLLTSDRPIFESPHAVTGVIGLALLTIQTILPSLFEGNPGLRNVHGILGSGIMTLFLVHAALGLQLGLSY